MDITIKQMMQIEENSHQMGFKRNFMMENAGAAVARFLSEKFLDISSKKILVFAGLGNNGGDALVVARHLAGFDSDVRVILLGSSDKIKTEEARTNWAILEKMNSIDLLISSDVSGLDLKADVVVDGILGTGISGKIREPYASAIDMINKLMAFKIAIDIPSGLDPDTGNTSDKCVKADVTITFHKMKVGIPKRKDVCGTILVEKIGIPTEAEVGVL
ncbi:MAG: NAD(P)H-hydrate epimerase [Thaumarchaeota archaeon]|nr:MAG: NAD(P)H-hydrate epimerase [Nitrososphaerota archaeon]TLX79985.1 MAG: NAD(P)H-hydrate epimerase [Nitrososphaerota archaeon]